MDTAAQHPARRRAGFSIEITNVGNQSTQVLDAYWQVDRDDDMDTRFNVKHGGGGVESLFTSDTRRADPTYSISPAVTRPVVEYVSRKHNTVAHSARQRQQLAINAQSRLLYRHCQEI